MNISGIEQKMMKGSTKSSNWLAMTPYTRNTARAIIRMKTGK